MNDKIVSLIEKNRDLDGEMLPVEKHKLLEELGKIPPNISADYSEFFGNYIDNLLVIRNIISLSNKPSLAKRLIDGLNGLQLKQLEMIVSELKREDREDRISEIIKETLRTLIKEECLEKTNQLISLIKQVILIREGEKAVFKMASTLKTFADFLNLHELIPQFEDIFFQRLSALDEDELDWFIELINKKVING